MTHKEIMRRSGCEVGTWLGNYHAIIRNGVDLYDIRPLSNGYFKFVPSHEARLRAQRYEYRKHAHPKLAEWVKKWRTGLFCVMSKESFATEDEAWAAIESLL